MYIKTLEECQKIVAIKYHLGKSLVIGHRPTYYNEAAEMYADQYKKLWQESLNIPKL